MNLGLLIFLLVIFISLFVGILYIYWPGSCNSINPCPSGQICSNGKCAITCNSSNPCPTGQLCYNGLCIPNITCSTANPCPNGQTCSNGKCVPNINCNTTNPCPSGQNCTGGKCVPSCITTSDIFTLNFKNALSFTFLQSNGGSLNATDIYTLPLDTSFQFIFQKLYCPGQNDPTINYGDLVQLVSYDILYTQCGAGTCSLNQLDGLKCQTKSWQTFTVRSATGKTGQVCFGDQIRLTQTVGSNCSISILTPVSGQPLPNIYCVDGDQDGSVFTILPV